MKEPITKVVFRVCKEGVVYALMPEIKADVAGRYCTSYEHVGQHGAADYYYCIATSRPAEPHEYQNLIDELGRVGYKVKVIQRYVRAR